MKDIVGKTFGTWFVEKQENNPNVKTLQNRYYRCICTCGNSFLVRYDNIIRRNHKGCSSCKRIIPKDTVITTRLKAIRSADDNILRAHILGLILTLGPQINLLCSDLKKPFVFMEIDKLIKGVLEEPIVINKQDFLT